MNRMARTISRFDSLPGPLRRRAISFLMGRMVPYVGTSALLIDEMTPDRIAVSLRNVRKVQNHIKGVHAAAMALLAETASGFVTAMNLPDDKLPLIKSLKVQYKKRTQGAMKAVAVLSAEQRKRLMTEERGDITVETHVTDESGAEPITCEMVWAWVPKRG
jgi:acyl-coenzyme A thioesterase PaaI-like protein